MRGKKVNFLYPFHSSLHKDSTPLDLIQRSSHLWTSEFLGSLPISNGLESRESSHENSKNDNAKNPNSSEEEILTLTNGNKIEGEKEGERNNANSSIISVRVGFICSRNKINSDQNLRLSKERTFLF